MILVHGTEDRLVPYDGSEGSLFGFYPSGRNLSTFESARYFASRAGLVSPPVTIRSVSTDGFPVEFFRWQDDSAKEVQLVTIHGAGHVFPQPYYRARHILGPSPKDPNIAEVIWKFFSDRSEQVRDSGTDSPPTLPLGPERLRQ